MDTLLFELDIKQKLKNLFRADDFAVMPTEIIVPSALEHDHKIKLDDDSMYYLVSKELDIPLTAALYLSSETDFLSSSKTDWEYDNDYKTAIFRNYLHVRTENASAAFAFKLKFLKVTPFRNIN